MSEVREKWHFTFLVKGLVDGIKALIYKPERWEPTRRDNTNLVAPLWWFLILYWEGAKIVGVMQPHYVRYGYSRIV